MLDLGNNYYLKADSFQFILVKKTIGVKGKSEGEMVETSIGYYPSVDLLLKKIFKDQLFSYLSEDEVASWQDFEDIWKKVVDVVEKADKRIGSISNIKRIFEEEKND